MSRDRWPCPSCFHNHILLVLILSGIVSGIPVNTNEKKGIYIIYLGEPLENAEIAIRRHAEILSSIKGSDDEAGESIVYSYTKTFNAFAAKLSEDEAKEISTMREVISVLPSRHLKLHTTRSWDFIGLPQTAKRNLKLESDVVVGMLDTGINPKSKSFNDHGLGPPPKKWKGTCGPFVNFTCNNKIIGARYFKVDGIPDPEDVMSPLDADGHGSHTASIVAGSKVASASLYGLAAGVARGAVPAARLAAYKVCWERSCEEADILAGFDAAIADGVDIISISLGAGSLINYNYNSIAIGAFHAMKNGVLVVASAGNGGPDLGSVENHAPWMLTVAASGIDREFRSKVVLGNRWTTAGIGVSTFNIKQKLYPLVRGGDIPQNSSLKEEARLCFPESLDPAKVKGKLIYCEILRSDVTFKELGGVGTIMQTPKYLDTASIFVAPATLVDPTVAHAILRYINSTRSPTAQIYDTQAVKIPAPFVASFSSRGPNPGSTHVLKPDIAAPGIDILAAYTPLNSLTGLPGDSRHSEYTLMSGTSMSCPHVAGVAAYVKSFHPDWSPAAIMSAILTSAKPMSKRVDHHGEYAYGAGQVQPRNAVSPGLVYDMDMMSYVQFLCNEGYSGSSVGVFVGKKSVNCSELIPAPSYDALNYPTMKLELASDFKPIVGVFRRRVTNVGPPTSVYNATIRAPKGVDITVKPMTLSFSGASQKLSFKVIVKGQLSTAMSSGSLIWASSSHIVRSPIVISGPLIKERRAKFDKDNRKNDKSWEGKADQL